MAKIVSYRQSGKTHSYDLTFCYNSGLIRDLKTYYIQIISTPSVPDSAIPQLGHLSAELLMGDFACPHGFDDLHQLNSILLLILQSP